MLAGKKGTKEYDAIMVKLQEQNYKHQADAENTKNKKHLEEKDFIEKEESKHILETKDPERINGTGEILHEKKAVTMSRIMSYYYPKWLAYAGVFVSMINAFSFPIYGLIYAKLLFIMMKF